MSQDVLTTKRPPGTDADLVIREARRRQRRRRLVVGLALAAALAGAIGVAASLTSGGRPPASRPRPRPSAPATRQGVLPPPIPRSVGSTVLMWPVVAHGEYPAFGPNTWPPAYLDDLATGRLSQQHKLAFAGGDYRPYLVHVGHWLVYVGRRGAMAIPDSLSGRPRLLGGTPFFAPAASPGHIWLERIRGVLGEGGRASVWQVSVRTGLGGPVIDLPRGSQLVAGTGTGLLLEVPRGHDFALALWHPGGTPAALPYASRWDFGYGLDASSRLIAYGTGCRDHTTVRNDYYPTCQVLRVFDVVTGRVQSFGRPPGTAGWMPLGIGASQAIAPGGRMIAAYAATLPLGRGRDRLFVLRLSGTGGAPHAVPGSSAVLYPRTAWSPGGSWLFYQGPGGHLWAYRASSGRVGASGTPCCGYTVMTAFPSTGR